MTANEMARSTEEATVYVDDLDVSVTMVLLEDSPAVLSLASLREERATNRNWKWEICIVGRF